MRAKRAIWRQFGCKYLLFYRILIADTVANTQNKMKLKKKKKFAQNLWCVKMSKQLQESGAWRYDVFVWKFYHFFFFHLRYFLQFHFFFSPDICSVYSGIGCLLAPIKKKSRTKIIQKQRVNGYGLWKKILFGKGMYRMTFYRKSFNFFFFFFYST